jgi:hypothetical protein
LPLRLGPCVSDPALQTAAQSCPACRRRWTIIYARPYPYTGRVVAIIHAGRVVGGDMEQNWTGNRRCQRFRELTGHLDNENGLVGLLAYESTETALGDRMSNNVGGWQAYIP